MFNFYTNNFLLDANTNVEIITGGENAQFPLVNVKHPFTTKSFRSTSSTSEILVDLIATRSVDSFIVVGNATGTLGFNSLKIYGSSTEDFSASTERIIDFSAEHNVGYLMFDEVQSFRFWKIVMTNTEGYCELSNFFIGQKTSLVDNGLSLDTFKYKLIDLSTVTRNQYGQKFINRKISIMQISGTFQYLNKAEHELVLQVYNDHGQHTPIWVCLDPTSCTAVDGKWLYTGYYYINNDMEAQADGPGLVSIPITLDQVV